jgi:hypothetical protein
MNADDPLLASRMMSSLLDTPPTHMTPASVLMTYSIIPFTPIQGFLVKNTRKGNIIVNPFGELSNSSTGKSGRGALIWRVWHERGVRIRHVLTRLTTNEMGQRRLYHQERNIGVFEA